MLRTIISLKIKEFVRLCLGEAAAVGRPDLLRARPTSFLRLRPLGPPLTHATMSKRSAAASAGASPSTEEQQPRTRSAVAAALSKSGGGSSNAVPLSMRAAQTLTHIEAREASREASRARNKKARVVTEATPICGSGSAIPQLDVAEAAIAAAFRTARDDALPDATVRAAASTAAPDIDDSTLDALLKRMEDENKIMCHEGTVHLI